MRTKFGEKRRRQRVKTKRALRAQNSFIFWCYRKRMNELFVLNLSRKQPSQRLPFWLDTLILCWLLFVAWLFIMARFFVILLFKWNKQIDKHVYITDTMTWFPRFLPSFLANVQIEWRCAQQIILERCVSQSPLAHSRHRRYTAVENSIQLLQLSLACRLDLSHVTARIVWTSFGFPFSFRSSRTVKAHRPLYNFIRHMQRRS